MNLDNANSKSHTHIYIYIFIVLCFWPTSHSAGYHPGRHESRRVPPNRN